MKIKSNAEPPLDVHDVNSWRELPATIKPAKYRICNENGKEITAYISKKQRQVLEAVMQKPVVAASRCRISNCISLLKNNYGVQIDTLMFESGEGCYRIYFLKSDVECISENRSPA